MNFTVLCLLGGWENLGVERSRNFPIVSQRGSPVEVWLGGVCAGTPAKEGYFVFMPLCPQELERQECVKP